MKHSFENPECICDPGYMGDDCTKKEIKCAEDCHGNGDCNLNTGKCECHADFEGINCSAHKSCAKDLNGCSGHGICLGKICACDNGYSETDCSIKVDLSKYIPKCKNGIYNAIQGGSRSYCRCVPGWKGDSCDEVTEL